MSAIQGKGVGEHRDAIIADDVTLFKTRSLVKRCNSMSDKAMIIEREVGTETLYTLLAMGKGLPVIASGLGLSVGELEFVLMRSTEHRHKFALAGTFDLARGSIETMANFKDVPVIDKDMSAALSHHRQVLDMWLKNSKQVNDASAGVVVNNTIVVGEQSATPPLPDELSGVLEGEFTDVEAL